VKWTERLPIWLSSQFTRDFGSIVGIRELPGYARMDVEWLSQPEPEIWAMLIFSKPFLCPNCASTATHRSRRKGFFEQILHTIFFVSPLRCEVCDERFFRVRFLNRAISA
jgi:hypothetical protein